MDKKSIFVGGSKTRPTYLVEINKNIIEIFIPDKASSGETDFYEKYSLGNLIWRKTIAGLFVKDEVCKIQEGKYYWVKQLFYKIKKNLFVLK